MKHLMSCTSSVTTCDDSVIVAAADPALMIAIAVGFVVLVALAVTGLILLMRRKAPWEVHQRDAGALVTREGVERPL